MLRAEQLADGCAVDGVGLLLELAHLAAFLEERRDCCLRRCGTASRIIAVAVTSLSISWTIASVGRSMR